MNTLAKLALAAGFATVLAASAARADDTSPAVDDRLLIVNGNTHQVIYDDGNDDLFCVTRVYCWQDAYGYFHWRRTMHCR
jgi:hypothetical protein